MSELAIYFATAIRGGASFEQLAARITALSAIGHVLTEHMASPATVDFGARDDAAIHAHDQALLARAHVMIADVTSPSTGTGYMIARALARGLPVLCLHAAGAPVSAMIAGSPEITTRAFVDDADFLRHVRAFLLAHAAAIPATRAKRIFLTGPPGSGKGTLGVRLAAITGAPHVSTGELLRTLVAEQPEHPHAVTIRACMDTGVLVPAEVMRDLVVERLGRDDCRLFGVVLDGYPPSRADLDNLVGAGITPDLVFALACSDATALARQVGRKARSTDTLDGARTRLAVYHAQTPGFAAIAAWYPTSLVVEVDAEQPPEAVEAFALATLRDAFARTPPLRSYFPIPPARPGDVRSTRLHFHVDARNVAAIRAIAHDLHVRHTPAQGQVKIYPIHALSLAPQHARLPIYRQLPNFHPISDATHEAFITGRLGDGDRALMQASLEVGRAHHAMVELEEYVGEWTLRTDGTTVTLATYALTSDDQAYPAFADARCTDIPTWELHHGFDVPKATHATLPISLPALVAACAEAGLDNGGWFVFGNDHHWAYRSNEFSSDPEDVVRDRVSTQAAALSALLSARGLRVEIGYSLERVHGIWTF